MNSIKTFITDLHDFLIVWFTQSLSSLGSAMTNFALVVWSYQLYGSALKTALIAVCSYAPFVLMSVFAGALCDRWNKKAVMLISDSFAALCTAVVFALLLTGELRLWHLYVLNLLNGLMNTFQQPASDVAASLLAPKKYYQKVSGMKSFANSLVGVLTPVLATSLFSLVGIEAVIVFDLLTFAAAFFALLFFVKIPEPDRAGKPKESAFKSVKSGLLYLKDNRGILDLILFLAAINFINSIYNAALPAMILSKNGGGEVALGLVNATVGIATLAGSIIVLTLPTPKSRVRIILNSLLISMSTENFFLAFGRTASVWCAGAALGWITVPFMGANMSALFRIYIPVEMQGRVYSARNSFQYFTIPIGYFLGGILVDKVFEPLMARQASGTLLAMLFGTGKGSGAAFLFFILAVAGTAVCLVFKKDKHILGLENNE